MNVRVVEPLPAVDHTTKDAFTLRIVLVTKPLELGAYACFVNCNPRVGEAVEGRFNDKANGLHEGGKCLIRQRRYFKTQFLGRMPIGKLNFQNYCLKERGRV